MTNEEFIRHHREDDVRRLALTRSPEGVDLKWCLQQIEGWQLARKKLPTWAATEGLWYPVRLSMEQCSSEEAARYKRRVVERLIPEGRTSMVDLTGGLGVDFSQLAPLFREATYVEILPELRRLAEHNMPLLMGKKGGTELRFTNPEDSQLSALNSPLGPKGRLPMQELIFLDPARRDGVGRKTVAIEDCTPNVVEMQVELLARAQYVMVKLSPMLDIREALRRLHGVTEVHVVSVQGECKELLFVMTSEPHEFVLRSEGDGVEAKGGAVRSEETESPLTVCCVNLDTDEDVIHCPYPLPDALKAAHAPSLGGGRGRFLYEPNPSILKAGISDVLTERYPVSKLHPMSNLFVSEQFVAHFPGRRFRIVGMSDFGKRNLKRLLGDLKKANLTIRNFPATVEKLRRQLRLAEGGDTYLFATTLNDGQHALMRCEKA